MTTGSRADGRFALRAQRLFDGERWLDRPVVLVEDGRVAAAGETLPEDVTIVDLGDDTTLLPGIVDCHQHLCFNGQGTLEEQVSTVDDAALSTRARTASQRALAGGVTTLRDLGDRGWVTLALRGDAALPTIKAAGPPITRPDGHCSFLGGGCDSEAGLRAAVRERVERGCDVVKVMATGGALTVGRYPMWEPQFSLAELRLIVEEAHAAGLPVASHCHGPSGVERSVAAGVDSLEHCSFIDADGRVDADDAALERIAASGIAVSATIGRVPGTPLPPLAAANQEPIRRTLARLHQLGAAVVAGTDAGVTDAKRHDIATRALADLVEIGMTSTEGLRALTSSAARVCGVHLERGRLARGYSADVVAVAGDPTHDVENLTAVIGVWKSGRRVGH